MSRNGSEPPNIYEGVQPIDAQHDRSNQSTYHLLYFFPRSSSILALVLVFLAYFFIPSRLYTIWDDPGVLATLEHPLELYFPTGSLPGGEI